MGSKCPPRCHPWAHARPWAPLHLLLRSEGARGLCLQEEMTQVRGCQNQQSSGRGDMSRPQTAAVALWPLPFPCGNCQTLEWRPHGPVSLASWKDGEAPQRLAGKSGGDARNCPSHTQNVHRELRLLGEASGSRWTNNPAFRQIQDGEAGELDVGPATLNQNILRGC